MFLEAVKHYEDVYWDAAWTEMGDSADIREGMFVFFTNAARILTSQDVPCGCMVILGATNVSPEAQEVNNALRELRREGRDFILTRLKRAVAEGQLISGTGVDGLASTLNTVLEGMSLQARDGMTRSELERIAETVMALLPGAPAIRTSSRAAAGSPAKKQLRVESNPPKRKAL